MEAPKRLPPSPIPRPIATAVDDNETLDHLLSTVEQGIKG